MLELFTVSIKEDATVNIDFSENFMAIVSEDEIKSDLDETMQNMIPIIAEVVDYLKAKVRRFELEKAKKTK